MKVSKIIIEHKGKEYIFPVYETEPDEKFQGYWTELEVFPGCNGTTQGDTYDNLISNIEEVLYLLLEDG